MASIFSPFPFLSWFCLSYVPLPVSLFPFSGSNTPRRLARTISDSISKSGVHELVKGSYAQCVAWARTLAGSFTFFVMLAVLLDVG